MEQILQYTLIAALFIHVMLSVYSVWRVWRGRNAVDRLIAFDLTGTLTLAILVLAALIQEQTIIIDVAIGLAALGFISTLALARYATEEEMF